MGGDMVVALGRATVDGNTLFGQNSDGSARQCHTLKRTASREHAADEKICTALLELAQARQTYTVLGSQPEGWWGYTHGVNEHGLAAGYTTLRNRVLSLRRNITGADLVRLVLERCRSARQAVDLLTELVECHGQGAHSGTGGQLEGDCAFLIADAGEAFLVETAGEHWVYQEVLEVRAASNLCTVHQDWDRISRGLAQHVITQGWWPADGSKLDFAAAVGENPIGPDSALRRWGRATLLLEEQNGHIDAAFLRRLLSDHYEGTHFEVDPLASLQGPVPLCQHATGRAGRATAASFVAPLSAATDRLPMAWCAFGPPCVSLYVPIFLDGDIPVSFSVGASVPDMRSVWWHLDQLNERLRNHPEEWPLLRESFSRLQASYDQEALEFARDGAVLKQRGAHAELQRQATLFMEHALEKFEVVLNQERKRGQARLSSSSRKR